MRKFFSLFRASVTDGMSLFKINVKKKNIFTKVFLPIIICVLLMFSIGANAEAMIMSFDSNNMEYVLLSIYIFLVSIITLFEGMYKSSDLLFNCKDDDLLLSLPIKRSTVLFLRVFKFYIFELLFCSLFLLPVFVVYSIHVKPDFIFYIVSFIGLVLFPIIPVLLSCLFGTFIIHISSRFGSKNLIKTLLTFVFALVVLCIPFSFNNLLSDISKNASDINDLITKIYYPIKLYINLITDFNVLELIEFIFLNLILFVITIVLIGKIYFNISSSLKYVKNNNVDKSFSIKELSPTKSIIKKEFNRFINSSVYVFNAGFGLVIYVLGCVLIAIKFDSIVDAVLKVGIDVSSEYIRSIMPVLFLGFVGASSFMTSITSSMISLEGKSFYILKSLPISPYKIVKSKVLAAVLIMLPCILIGDIIIFIRFGFDLLSVILILFSSVLFPLISETLGIIVNLKYPKMDAKNDTEVVKQSMSSLISVAFGLVMISICSSIIAVLLISNISIYIVMFVIVFIYIIIYLLLSLFLRNRCDKYFDDIVV